MPGVGSFTTIETGDLPAVRQRINVHFANRTFGRQGVDEFRPAKTKSIDQDLARMLHDAFLFRTLYPLALVRYPLIGKPGNE